MHPRLVQQIAELGIVDLFAHQALAYDAARAGRDLAVVTGTSSGKTLCYNLPVLQACLEEPSARALYLFPTKALAHDQLGKLEAMGGALGVRCAAYDGDTPQSARAAIRKSAHLVLTNPDMLHVGILPQHENWGRFLRSVRYVVLDEMHAYRGVFGSHVAHVLRRLFRLCAWYGSQPQVIACSATIANPEDLFLRLTGRDAVLIDQDGSPSGGRAVLFLAQPDPCDEPARGPNSESAALLVRLAREGYRALAFCRARVTTELVLRTARSMLRKADLPEEWIESYRGGYTASERRKIEADLFAGRIRGLATTNAMELGVDVGTLDAVVLNGLPSSVSSFWQQVGRAGRGTRPGLALALAHDDPMEQLMVRDPDLLLGSPIESVTVSPSNPHILAQQLRCAAYERPLSPSELSFFGAQSEPAAGALVETGELHFQGDRYYYPSHEPPAPGVNIRGSSSEQVELWVGTDRLGLMERWRAFGAAHVGAVYLHRGQSYVVQELNVDAGRAVLEPQSVEYYTLPVIQSILEPQALIAEKPWGRHKLSLSGLKVTSAVVGFRRVSLDGDRVLDAEELDLPPISYDTIGTQWHVDAEPYADDDPTGAPGLHGAEHALMAVAPLLAGCDRQDVGSAWYPLFPTTLRPAMFAFDAVAGGVGLTEKLFERADQWAMHALNLLIGCVCEDGCPLCLLSARCECANQALSKPAAIGLLSSLVP